MFTSTFPSEWKKAKVTPIYMYMYNKLLSKILERAAHDQRIIILIRFQK